MKDFTSAPSFDRLVMPAFLSLTCLAYATPDGRELFRNLDLSFGRELTGLVGRNGVGKSTLLRLIAGELTPAAGAVQRQGTIGVLRQIVQVGADETVADGLGVRTQLDQLARAVAGLSDASDAEPDWTLETRLAQAMARLDLAHVPLGRPLASLSGGERTRLALAGLTIDPLDFLVLDEPTNNLDREGRAVLRRFLADWRGGAVVVSHDRDLLRGMHRIVELSSLGASIHGGGWDLYAQRKAEDVAAAERALGRAERAVAATAERAQLAAERQARRDGAGKRSRAKAGASKLLLDARQDRAEKTSGRGQALADRQRAEAEGALAEARRRVEIVTPLTFAVSNGDAAHGKVILSFDRVTGGADPDRPAIRGLSFDMTGADRLAVVGPNGAGKSTLAKLAAGLIAPVEGTIRRAGHVVMLDQQVTLLDPAASILDNFRRLNPGCNDNACRAALARFLFRADAALAPVGHLSGGEMLRAGLAATLAGDRPPDLLILDEPTNHLDLAAIAAVETALAGFGGALMMVSHDEDFLAALGLDRRLVLPVQGQAR